MLACATSRQSVVYFCLWPIQLAFPFVESPTTIKVPEVPQARRKAIRRKHEDPNQLTFAFAKDEKSINAFELPTLKLSEMDIVACKHLIAAVLTDGMRKAACGHLAEVEWVEVEDDEPFSFSWCCDRLGLDYETVRRDWTRHREKWQKLGRGRTKRA